jgi:hypothetical protein
MQISGRVVAEQMLQINVQAGGFEQVGTANDLINMLTLVVDGDGEMIGINAVGSS